MQNNKPSLARSLRITTSASWIGILCIGFFLLSGCAASKAEIRRANNSGYDTDFATVYGETLAVVQHLYPHSVEDAATGLIRTAWHLVDVKSGSGQQNNRSGSQVSGVQNGGSGIGAIAGTSASDRKHYFIRFRVHVLGGKPWRIRVRGEASERGAGDVPLPLKGAEVPPWLKGRTDALRVTIHKRLKKHAVLVTRTIPAASSPILFTKEPSSFGDMPEAAHELVATVHRALRSRDLELLRESMVDDLRWSVTEAGSAVVAIALWQADGTVLDAFSKVLEGGCTLGDGALSVSCPAAYSSEANYRGYRAIFEKRGKQWLLTAFFTAE